MSTDLSHSNGGVATGNVKAKCPNCGYIGLGKGEFCPFCKTYLSTENIFIRVGDENYPTYANIHDITHDKSVEEDHERIERLKKLFFKKKQVRNVSILSVVILVQIFWLLFR